MSVNGAGPAREARRGVRQRGSERAPQARAPRSLARGRVVDAAAAPASC